MPCKKIKNPLQGNQLSFQLNLAKTVKPGRDMNLDKHAAAELLGISTATLARYRKRHWVEGVHYTRLEPQTIRYNEPLIRDWQANRSDPAAHQSAIEMWRASLTFR
jgi:hypothetical protein